MHTRKHTVGCFALEALNSLGTTYYFYYIYFFTERQFGFTKMQNLLLAASIGLVYGLASLAGGRFAQTRGYFTALKIGYAVMAAMMCLGAFVESLGAHLAIMVVATCGMALTWPALEALVSEGEPRARLQRNLGIYNLIWSGFGAVAYFTGGAIYEKASFQAMFLLPAGIHVAQLVLALIVERWPHLERNAPAPRDPFAAAHAREVAQATVSPPTFLRMAWLANPFAYLAINTVIAVVPALATRLELNVVQAGIFCSIWLFVRTASFGALWLWPGWHYRFGWLAGAYAAMTGSFVVMLVAANLWVVVAAQVVFGLALGLIYYSSLYYSMDVGDTKGEHGGFHEAMIGVGSFAGPAIGALGLYFVPYSIHSSTWWPAGLLVAGFGALTWLRLRKSEKETK
jgi:MFS family permease